MFKIFKFAEVNLVSLIIHFQNKIFLNQNMLGKYFY